MKIRHVVLALGVLALTAGTAAAQTRPVPTLPSSPPVTTPPPVAPAPPSMPAPPIGTPSTIDPRTGLPSGLPQSDPRTGLPPLPSASPSGTLSTPPTPSPPSPIPQNANPPGTPITPSNVDPRTGLPR